MVELRTLEVEGVSEGFGEKTCLCWTNILSSR